jgi:hypothetical protein
MKTVCQEKLHRIQYLQHQIKEKENEINELTEFTISE